jgi:hypothetical protein
MNEWTISLETAPGRLTEDEAELLLAALEADSGALNPVISLGIEKDTVSATYQVEADDYPAAVSAAILIFFDAQRAIDTLPTMRGMRVDLVGDPRAV